MILSILRAILTPLTSVFFFVVGSSLFMTLLALRLGLNNVEPTIIGLMTTAYYLGFALGSFRITKFILRVGHIRAFATFASMLAIIYLLHGIYVATWFWLGLRVVGGVAAAGILIVIESWLLVSGTTNTRGQILAFYLVAFYAAQAAGQFLLNLANPTRLLLYAVSAISASLAVIPLAMTRIQSPSIELPSTINLKKLYSISPTGVVGCFCAGLILGAAYGLMPVYYLKVSGNVTNVSWLMAAFIFGGMMLQYPIGKISDYTDRRTVLISVSLLAVLTAVVIILSAQFFWLLFTMSFFFGGLIFTLYPISVSYASDFLAPQDSIGGAQSLLLTYGIGACLGPIVASVFMSHLVSVGIFIYYIIICLVLAFFFLWRKKQKLPAPKQMQEQYIPVPQTTTVISELDPRGEEEKI